MAYWAASFPAVVVVGITKSFAVTADFIMRRSAILQTMFVAAVWAANLFVPTVINHVAKPRALVALD